MEHLITVQTAQDIPPQYKNSPIGLLLEYHNLNKPMERIKTPQLLIGMCMDNRKNLHIPKNFAFIMRAGGANLQNNEFNISYAIGVGNVRAIALIAHTQCGMVNIAQRRELFIQGLVDNAGWVRNQAEEHFLQYAPKFEIHDATYFTLSEARRIRDRYPKVLVAPLLYRVEDNRLYLIREEQ